MSVRRVTTKMTELVKMSMSVLVNLVLIQRDVPMLKVGTLNYHELTDSFHWAFSFRVFFISGH